MKNNMKNLMKIIRGIKPSMDCFDILARYGAEEYYFPADESGIVKLRATKRLLEKILRTGIIYGDNIESKAAQDRCKELARLENEIPIFYDVYGNVLVLTLIEKWACFNVYAYRQSDPAEMTAYAMKMLKMKGAEIQ